MNDVKKKYWAFILYLDSAPIDWIDTLQMTGLPFCISPYHDKDINPTGEPKKPHYHIILAYNGNTTFNNVKRITDSLNQPIPIPLDSVKGYFRYLTHLDNPEKYQYDSADIRYVNGFDINDYFDLTFNEILKIKITIHEIILENNFFEYSDLMDYLLSIGDMNLYQVASTHTIHFNAVLKSRRHKLT